MQNFEYCVPTKVVFGRDTESRCGELVRECGGTHALVVYGGGSAVRSGLLGRCTDSLKAAGIPYELLGGVQPNPRLSRVREGIALAKETGADFLLAVGGGKRVGGACTEADSAGAHEVRENHDKVVSHGVDGTLHLLAGACADGNDRNHGRNADDDAERRQKAAHLVAPNRTQRNPEYH